MKELVKVMKALADPGRIKIVKMLEVRELCVCEIHAALDLAQPIISKHLRILEEAGLVDKRKDGQFVIYFLPSFAPNSPCLPVLSEVLVWAGRSSEIRELLERLVRIDRYAICKQRRSNEDAR
ncbi:ArsR/SmtB family transcription factor [Desulfoplanes sp. PS50]